MLKALSVLRILTLLSLRFCYIQKQLDKKAKENFKPFDVTDCTTNNNNTRIPQYLKK